MIDLNTINEANNAEVLSTFNTKKLYFTSLGCSKNLVDSQVMLGYLGLDGFSVTQEPSEAEVIIVNTCSFIEASKKESIDTILELADFKKPENGKAKLVMYYADWCGHCKRAKPEMEKLEEKLKEQNNKVNGKEVEVVYVDGDQEEELLKKEDVQGFPTIRLYRLSDMIEYQGERAADALMGFLEEKL